MTTNILNFFKKDKGQNISINFRPIQTDQWTQLIHILYQFQEILFKAVYKAVYGISKVRKLSR